jgi:hypothetical protein
MPASGWTAVTDRVLDRTEDWINEIYNQIPDYGLELTSTLPGPAPTPPALSGEAASMEEAGRITSAGIPSRYSVANADEESSENSYDGASDSGSESSSAILNAISSVLVDRILGKTGRAMISVGSVSAALLYRSTENKKDVTFHGIVGSGGNALVIPIGADLSDGRAATLILLRVGTMTNEFKKVVEATCGDGSPWASKNIGNAPDPFALADDLVKQKKKAITEVQKELERDVKIAEVVISLTPVGDMIGFIEAASDNRPFDAVLNAGDLFANIGGKVVKIPGKLGYMLVYQMREEPSESI